MDAEDDEGGERPRDRWDERARDIVHGWLHGGADEEGDISRALREAYEAGLRDGAVERDRLRHELDAARGVMEARPAS